MQMCGPLISPFNLLFVCSVVTLKIRRLGTINKDKDKPLPRHHPLRGPRHHPLRGRKMINSELLGQWPCRPDKKPLRVCLSLRRVRQSHLDIPANGFQTLALYQGKRFGHDLRMLN